MRINLYLPDEEKDIYKKAKDLLKSEGKSISRFFMECLKDYVRSKEGKPNTVIVRKITVESFDAIAQRIIKALLPKGFKIKLMPIGEKHEPLWIITSPDGKIVSALDYKLRYYPKRLLELVKRLRKPLLENSIPFLTVVIFNELDVKTNSPQPRIEKIIVFDLRKMTEFLFTRDSTDQVSEEARMLFKKLFGNKA